MKKLFFTLIAWLFVFTLMLPLQSQAATITVTNGGDAGAGTLRAAIASAVAGDVIDFSGVTTVTLTSDQLFINKNLTINGGTGVTITRDASAANFRIFNITSGSAVVEFNKLTITNGKAVPPGGNQAAGIQNSGTLTLNDCILANNESGVQSGGIQNDKTLTMNRCFVHSNSAPFSGSGLLIYGSSTTTLNNCVFTNNQGNYAIDIQSAATLTITNCTIAKNTGGINVGSGSAVVTLKNTIVAENTTNILNNVSVSSAYNLIGTEGGNGGLTNGTNNNFVGASPLFANSSDPDGTDNLFGTADDGLIPLTCSPPLNAGNTANAPAGMDIASKTRTFGANVDMGAYEVQAASTPQPAITLGSIPTTILAGATSFTIPYTATGTPTTFSISGTGFTTLTDAALPSSPITVNLSPAASINIDFTLTVKSAGGCTSSAKTGSIAVLTPLTDACATATFNGIAPIAPTTTTAGVGGKGSIYTYTVPAGVTSIRLDAKGAKGGSSPYTESGGGVHPGGTGGRVQATYAVMPGDVLYILVGGKGGNGSPDDGITGRTASGGGGATVVSKGPIAAGTLLLVAGGGGGAGHSGGGGVSNNSPGNGSGFNGAGGASFSAAGGNSNQSDDCGKGGQALNAGGNGGANTCFRPETNGGGYGGGGAGNYNTNNGNAGGGGGGGYVGGNAGGTSGGNGGSSYNDPSATNVMTTNHSDDNGSVVITVAATISYTGSPFCKSLTATAAPTTTGYTGGTFSSTLGLTIDPNTGVINPSTSTPGNYTVSYNTLVGCTAATTTVTVNALPTVNGPANLLDNSTTGQCGKIITYNTSTTGTPMPTITYALSGATIASGSGNGSGSFFNVGETTVTLTATNICSTANYSFIVTILGTPTLTLGTIPAICAGSTSFTIPYTATTGTPTTYSISGTGITAVTDGALPSGSITVNLSAAASGSSIPFTLTVKNASGCISANISESVTVSETPSLTLGTIPAICAGVTSFTVPYTATTGSPTTYSISGTGITTVTDAALPSGSITVNLSAAASGSSIPFTLTVKNAIGCISTSSASVLILSKPSITLTTQNQVMNEGNSQTLCDTDADPVNSLQFAVSSACVAGSLVWRVQVGNGTWSDWSATSPVSQLSNNQMYRYQAACDANCPATYTNTISITINYRAFAPQNVSMVADGTTVLAGEEKSICDQVGNALTFNATCATGEILLYSVDGGVYVPQAPTQIVDGNFHNYRLRCRKADGTSSCVETESAVMSLKITNISVAPTASISPTSGCGTPTAFSGNATCGSLTTIWYNAATNQALPTLPAQTPNATTSYYARCQTAVSVGETGCLSEKSNVVTFTLTPVNEAPIVTASAEVVCTGTVVTVSANCPAGSTAFWNTGVTTNSFQVAFSNVTQQTYWARCIFNNGCQSTESSHKTITWKAFELTLINIGQSKSGIKPVNDKAAWASQFITADAGPSLDLSTEANPTLYYTENTNKTGPRYWTIQVETCALGTNGSVTYDMLASPEAGVKQSFNTHENNAPYFMYANREGFTELYAQNHPAYGFYQDNGSGGNVYDAGLPKGLYKLSIRYWDQKGQGSIYPSTRQPAGNILAYQEYWFRIQSKNGIGTGSARATAATDNGSFAQVMPNPVSNTLRLKVNDAKDQKVNISLVDASGRTLLQRVFVPQTNQHQEEFEVSDLANGMYFLRVDTVEKHATLKVVKVN